MASLEAQCPRFSHFCVQTLDGQVAALGGDGEAVKTGWLILSPKARSLVSTSRLVFCASETRT